MRGMCVCVWGVGVGVNPETEREKTRETKKKIDQQRDWRSIITQTVDKNRQEKRPNVS